MGRNLVETLIGAVVLAVAIGFVTYAYTRTDVGTVSGYEIIAKFTAVDGLNVGDDVRISGIKVGSVVDMRLDPEFFEAVVRFSVDPSVALPTDTTAAIVSESLLGGKYLALEPGGADELIQAGGEIEYTQPSVNLESLFGKVIYSFTSGGGEKGGSGEP